MQPLSFFTDRIGSFVKRGSTDVFIKDLDTARKLYEVQDEKLGYVFAAPLRVTRAVDSGVCVSCEG